MSRETPADPGEGGEPEVHYVLTESPPERTFLQRVRDFAHRVFEKAGEDNIFFMAGAISFNVILAVIPLLLLVVGIGGVVLSARFDDPAERILQFFLTALPAGEEVGLTTWARSLIGGLIEQRTGIGVVGAVFFIWLSTRLVGTLRTALREVFDVGRDRGIVRGKIFDAQIVVVASILLVLNVGITVGLRALGNYGFRRVVGLTGRPLELSQSLVGQGVALLSIWLLFLLIYRYLLLRRIPWRTTLLAATFSAFIHEAMKIGFSWYVTNVANYGSVFGNLATVAIFFLWIYYGAVVFILGGEIAQVYTMKKATKVARLRELFENGRG